LADIHHTFYRVNQWLRVRFHHCEKVQQGQNDDQPIDYAQIDKDRRDIVPRKQGAEAGNVYGNGGDSQSGDILPQYQRGRHIASQAYCP
jgi:hypothetical protein